MIHESIPSNVDHLLKTCRQITLENTHNKEQDLISMKYDPNTLVDTIYLAPSINVATSTYL